MSTRLPPWTIPPEDKDLLDCGFVMTHERRQNIVDVLFPKTALPEWLIRERTRGRIDAQREKRAKERRRKLNSNGEFTPGQLRYLQYILGPGQSWEPMTPERRQRLLQRLEKHMGRAAYAACLAAYQSQQGKPCPTPSSDK